MKLLYALTLLLACLARPSTAAPTLAVTANGTTQTYSSAQLLARPDAAELTIPNDVSYKRTMTYRAVPLRALLPATGRDKADTIEIRATDGFVAQLPRALTQGKAAAWIAVEDPAHPWPRLPNKPASAGPFYLVWHNPAGISPEQWPYAIAALTTVASPAQRWPAIAVGESASVPAQRGQAAFVANCLACHRLAGNGEGSVGPDLLRPVPATMYLTDAGLHALIRNSAAVRSWPEQRMPAFDAAVLPDRDIDSIIAYLHALAVRLH